MYRNKKSCGWDTFFRSVVSLLSPRLRKYSGVAWRARLHGGNGCETFVTLAKRASRSRSYGKNVLQVFLWISVTVFASADDRPNVLFIVCDDLNTHVSTSDYPYISTPAFDVLAESGMTFKRAYCQYPVCGPSRASFLSGLYPESTGVVNNTADLRDTRPGTMTMPQAFKEQGYWTAATGKIFHNAKMDPGDEVWNERAFFLNDEMPLEKQARKDFEAKYGSIEKRENKKHWREFLLKYAPQTMNQTPGWGPSGLSDDQHRDGKNALQALEWIEDRSFGDKPFFMAVGIHKPHVPFLAPDQVF